MLVPGLANQFLPDQYKPKNVAIRLTGKAIAGTITAFKFPKNK